MAVIWTLGTEGRKDEQILRMVEEYGIRNVIDIRELPLTREGIPKWPVADRLKQQAVRYQNRRELAPGDDVKALLLPPEDEKASKADGAKDDKKAKEAGKKADAGKDDKAGKKDEKAKDAAKKDKPFQPDWDAFKEAYKEAVPEKAVRQVAADATLTPTLLISGSRDPHKGPRQALCEMMAEYDVRPKHIV